jgi:type III secretion system YscD/HrpQ family protein
VGHVSTATDRSQLLYALRGLNFIRNLDDSGLVVDEGVWREINQVMERNPDWKGINVISTQPGQFVVTGFLKTHSQSDRLAEYLSANFPYPDLLENRVVIEEDVLSSAASILQNHGLRSVNVKLLNGELTLTGGIPQGKDSELAAAITELKGIRGVRAIRNATSGTASKESFVNISDKYEVSGVSNQGGKLSVVINGRILMKGDILDGMTITAIQPHSIHLEKDSTQYRIDFTH